MTKFGTSGRFGASRNSSGGFTLVEVLLAIAIGAIILGGISSTLFSLTSSEERVSKVTARDRIARRLLFRIRREVEAIQRNHPLGTIRGADAKDRDDMDIRTSAYGEFSEVKYFWRDGVLWRSAASGGEAVAPDPVRLESVEKFTVRYYGEKGWEESWSSPATPRGVSILLTIDGMNYGSVIAP